MTYNEQYYKYLGKISWKGKFFRQRIVYPNIHSWATGHTLDIGCGLGLFLKTDSNAIGVDINEFCVQHCHKISYAEYRPGVSATTSRHNLRVS